ncbi:MAG: cell division protein FtsZ [Solirubrobacterales bacterium]|nr:cell division protein FtsZ [Solirubrobacterales bacterium]
MPTGKRASMREGPLADLFRKTAGDASPDRPAQEPPAPARPAPESEAAAEAEPPAETKPATPTASVPDAPARRSTERPRPARRAPARRAPARRAAEGPQSHPSLGSAPTQPAEQERHIPSPQERLRHAFSADIPENVLERPAAHRQPEPDVYARAERVEEAFAVPESVGRPVLRVVGVGGAGVNAVNRMVEAEIAGVEFVAINTDLQSLQQSAAHETLHIGDGVTRGLGSGSDPELGRQAAREEYDRIKAMLRGSDMVFIAAGAGGGTGTGAAPIVAQIAREVGALTVGIVTRPFQFEGSRRREQAEAGIAALAREVDTLIVVPNNRLLSVLDRGTSMVEAFRVADDVLRQGVQGISDLVTLPGLINLDFADVRTIMSDAGNALLGIGMGTGERRAIDAAEQAVASPLLETSMDGARSILLSITGGRDLSLWEVNEAAKAVAEAAHPDANIIFGAMLDEKLDEQVWVTVVATGYGEYRSRRREEEPLGLSASREPEPSPQFREPSGEPRVSRVRQRSSGSPNEFDVPEFIPRR